MNYFFHFYDKNAKKERFSQKNVKNVLIFCYFPFLLSNGMVNRR